MSKKMLSMSALLLLSCLAFAGVPIRFEELAAPDFIKAVEKSGQICIIPLGIIEKHGALVRHLKEDNKTMELMERFYRESELPLKTEQ